jgi:hypothetical protein
MRNRWNAAAAIGDTRIAEPLMGCRGVIMLFII